MNKPNYFNNRYVRILCLVLSLLNINACAPLIVASAASTFAVIADRRTTGTVVEDSAIELKAARALKNDAEIVKNSNVSISSYNERVLLTGQAANERIKNKIVDTVKNVSKVRTIYNEIAVAQPESFRSSSYDTWLTTKVKANLTSSTEVNPINIKVKTDSKTVYLMGLVTPTEGDKATEITRQIGGVQKVVKLFEYIDPSDGSSNNQYAMN